jgi:hypothetical protein
MNGVERDNRPVTDLFELNGRLFRNCLVGLSEADGQARPNQHTNCVAFIAGHLVETRAWMARQLGVDCPAPFGGGLEHPKSLAEVAALPRHRLSGCQASQTRCAVWWVF